MFRNVCFTDYDVSEERRDFLLGLDVQYIVFQEEECPETQRRHFQGYCELTKRMRLNAVKRHMMSNSIHIERRRGKQMEAIAYCKKEESRVAGPWEAGQPKQQGKRKDLEEIKEKLDNKRPMSEIADQHFSNWVRYRKSFDAYAELRRRSSAKKVPPTVFVFFGDAGTGKTRTVYDNHEGEEIFSKPSGKWFDGYVGQRVALFDDFTGELGLGLFLKVIDRYPITVEIKCGTVFWNPEVIYITSNLSPEDWYPNANPAQHVAIRRRISVLKRFEAGKEPVELPMPPNLLGAAPAADAEPEDDEFGRIHAAVASFNMPGQ